MILRPYPTPSLPPTRRGLFFFLSYKVHDLHDLNDFLRVEKSFKSFISFKSCSWLGIEQTAQLVKPPFPLALSQFFRRIKDDACKNWSAAPGCGALLLLRPSRRACKRQTAAPAPLRLLRPQDAAQLRSHSRLPVSSAGRGRRSCKSFISFKSFTL